VAREFHEELGAVVQVGPILDAWVYEVLTGRFVFIVTYALYRSGIEQLKSSAEHKQMRWCPLQALSEATMPSGYRRSIDAWAALMTNQGGFAATGPEPAREIQLPVQDIDD
jgi:8-oxo-dGTP pyrophosphatase MutT (NUDIX family)